MYQVISSNGSSWGRSSGKGLSGGYIKMIIRIQWRKWGFSYKYEISNNNNNHKIEGIPWSLSNTISTDTRGGRGRVKTEDATTMSKFNGSPTDGEWLVQDARNSNYFIDTYIHSTIDLTTATTTHDETDHWQLESRRRKRIIASFSISFSKRSFLSIITEWQANHAERGEYRLINVG